MTVARRLTLGLLIISISSSVSPRNALILRRLFLACSLIPEGESSSGGRSVICSLSPPPAPWTGTRFSLAGEAW